MSVPDFEIHLVRPGAPTVGLRPCLLLGLRARLPCGTETSPPELSLWCAVSDSEDRWRAFLLERKLQACYVLTWEVMKLCVPFHEVQ